VTAFGRPSSAWRSPYAVPLYALITASLLAMGVSALGGPATTLEVVGPSPPETAPPTAAAAPVASFTPATDGKPVFSVTVDDPALRQQQILWTVMAMVDGQPGAFAPLRLPASIPPNSEQPLEESLVDRLLCVTVPEGWAVSVPPGLADLAGAATGVDAERTACQGGWSDLRAIPATLTFLAGESE
jgi:hypothetical protein